MTEQQLADLEQWFNEFTASFKGDSAADQRNYDLKVEHTLLVTGIIKRLARSVRLSPGESRLAAAAALCHDVGRFPQYRDFGTFNDATSVNHAVLSVQTLKKEGVPDLLDQGDRQVLLVAVALHNRFLLPQLADARVALLARMLRDADKIDIWRVLIEYYTQPAEQRASAVIWELPETGSCSEDALAEVRAGRMLNRSLLKTADDFTLLQLSWIFDLNLPESLIILAEHHYLDTLATFLPHQKGCDEAVAAVNRYLKAASLEVC